MKIRYLAIFSILFFLAAIGKVYAQSLDINDQSGETGDTVNFTVSMNNIPNAVGALQFEVSYDTSVLDFTDNFTKGDLVSGFSYFDVSEISSGQIRVAGITTTELESGVSGEVVKLEFMVKSCANSTLTLTGLEDDLSGWSTGNGQFSCTLVSETPTPTPVTSPTLPPTVCEAEKVAVSMTTLTLGRKKMGDVTVTVNGDTCDVVAGETVMATINKTGKKLLSISPTITQTDDYGQAVFTITAKKKIGEGRVTFKAGSVKKSITVKVRK